jgi:membrane protein DedA with SNARE-associated domain
MSIQGQETVPGESEPPSPAGRLNRWQRLPEQKRQQILTILIILGVTGISLVMLLFQDQVKQLGEWGYVGLFLVAFFASAAMFAPVPGLIFLAASAKVMDPLAAGLIFAVGASLGELSGYLVGSRGQGVIQKTKWHERMERWMLKYGGIVIVILGFIPNVLIDVAGMVAGALKMPWYRFLFWVFLGKVPKCLLITFGVPVILKWFGVQ